MTFVRIATPEVRFWQKVRIVGACWEWQDCLTNGYGRLWVDRERGQVLAHRFIYERCFGPITSGRVVMHLCDNPRCVRPAHLREGTTKDNTDDMFAKGRGSLVGLFWNKNKTHCKRGHEFTPENILRTTSGGRRCRTCTQAFGRVQAAARKAARWKPRRESCGKGHPLTPENTYRWAAQPNHRVCRACHADYERRRRRTAKLTELLGAPSSETQEPFPGAAPERTDDQ